MIRKSFIFLDKIRYKSEQNIWSQGINNWNDFLNTRNVFGISPARKVFYNHTLKEAYRALREYESEFFIGMQDTWRLYDYFRDEAVFLDIEASDKGSITVIGLFDGIDTKTMVKSINLDKQLLKKELSRYKLILTFNGGSFDLPIMKNYFRDVLPRVPHIDLRHVCARAGLVGGLKHIEKQLGVERPDIIRDMYGGDPALLWRKFLATGNRRFLNLLVQYNEEDIVNLKLIAEKAIKELWSVTRLSDHSRSQHRWGCLS